SRLLIAASRRDACSTGARSRNRRRLQRVLSIVPVISSQRTTDEVPMKTLCRVLGVLLCAGATARAADIDALVKQLKDKDSDARRKAVKELGEAGKDAQPAAPALVQALKGSDLCVRRVAAQALGDIEADPKVAAKPLADVLKNPKEKKEVQAAAAGALGKMGAAGVAPLAAAVKDDATDNEVRRRAVEALGKIGPDAKAAIPALVS